MVDLKMMAMQLEVSRVNAGVLLRHATILVTVDYLARSFIAIPVTLTQ